MGTDRRSLRQSSGRRLRSAAAPVIACWSGREPPSTGGGHRPPQVVTAAVCHDGAEQAVNGHRRPLESFKTARNIPTPPMDTNGVAGRLKAVQAAAGETSKEGSGLLLPLPFVLLFLLYPCWPLLLRFIRWLVHIYQFFKYQRKRQAVILAHISPLIPLCRPLVLLHLPNRKCSL